MNENVLFLLSISLPPSGPTGCPASLPSSPEVAPCGCSSPLDSLLLWRAALSNEGREGREEEVAQEEM